MLYGDLQPVGRVHVDRQIIKRTSSDVVEVEVVSKGDRGDYGRSLSSQPGPAEARRALVQCSKSSIYVLLISEARRRDFEEWCDLG